jgi:microfibrillar-associated protein 1
MKEEKEKNLERKKIENKMMIIQTLNSTEQQKDEDVESDAAALPNDEDVNEALEYGFWKIRELKRLKRDHDERN